MDSCSRGFFQTRSHTDSHQNRIKDASAGTLGPKGQLLLDVFIRHRAVFSRTPFEPDPALDVGASGFPSQRWVSSRFYEWLRDNSVFSLTAGKGGAECPVEDFVSNIVDFDPSADRNRIFILTGLVGSGKSTFINFLISWYLSSRYDRGKFWFIRCNLDAVSDAEPLTHDHFIKAISRKIKRKITEIGQLTSAPTTAWPYADIEKLLDGALVPGAAVGQSSRCLHDAIRAINRLSGRRVILIIDNLDYVFHLNDRGIYARADNTGEFAALSQLAHIMRDISHGDVDLGRLGANVLFVLRQESYENLLVSPNKISTFAQDVHYENYFLKRPDWEAAIESRASLLQQAIDKINRPGVRDDLSRQLTPLIRGLQDDAAHLRGQMTERPSVSSFIRSVSKAGLRDLMQHFETWAWVKNEDTSFVFPHGRMAGDLHLGRLVYMLGGRRRFSQLYSSFPNIFLTNGDSEEVRRLFGAENFTHPHTYWLKYLIFAFVYANRQSPLPLERVVETFSPEKVHTGNAYHQVLVRLCLGSMSQVNASALIRAKKILHPDQKSVTIDNITATDRGIYCFDSVFWKLPYLQLVVEDYNMPVPLCLAKDFDLGNANLNPADQKTFPSDPFPEGPDYAYLTDDSDRYAARSSTMLRLRCRQVVQFLCILDWTYYKEKSTYPQVFSALPREMEPDFTRIFSDIRSEFNSLRYSRKEIDSDEECVALYSSTRKILDNNMGLFYHRCITGNR